MTIKEKTMIRAAAMQRDRDQGMSVEEIAGKYHVSTTIVYQYTHSTKPAMKPDEKASRFGPGFAAEWNMARYAILLGLRSAWPDEWNAARARILAVKK